MKVCLIKLGGSLITDKAQPHTLRPERIHQVAQEIKDIIQLRKDLRVILFNGNGSIGHPVAKQHKIPQGFNGSNTLGFCLLQQTTTQLNQIIVNTLLEQGIPAIGFQPSTLFWSENLTCRHLSLNIFEQIIEKKIVPVLYGDGIIDQDQGFNIISSDHLLALIAKYLANKRRYIIEKVVNLGDYDGVLDDKGELIEEINNFNYGAFKHCIKESEHLDISGGMANKIQALLELARWGHESWIINGGKKNNLANLILNQQSVGTKIHWLTTYSNSPLG